MKNDLMTNLGQKCPPVGPLQVDSLSPLEDMPLVVHCSLLPEALSKELGCKNIVYGKKLPYTHLKWSISDPVIKYKFKVHFVADSCDNHRTQYLNAKV